MFYPQANLYPQPGFFPQTVSSVYPQGSFGSPGNFTQSGFGPLGLQGTPHGSSVNPLSLYGIPQFAPQSALQQQAIQQLLAQQLSMRQPAFAGLNGISNGAAQLGAWPQQQLGPEQFNPAMPQQPYHHLLQQLAQYHHTVAQQLSQLAAQSAQGGAGAYPFAGQFIPNQLGTNFVPGITMH